MLDKIRTKTRAIVEDWEKNDNESFSYSSSNIFVLSEENANEITKVEKNGTDITDTATITLNTTTAQVTIELASGQSWSSDDIVKIYYKYNTYSDSEINEYIRAGLVWLSVFNYTTEDYEIESGDEIYPTPDNKTTDLVALVAGILIKPDYTEYRITNKVTVKYNNRITKDQKIESLVNKFKYSSGVMDVLEFN